MITWIVTEDKIQNYELEVAAIWKSMIFFRHSTRIIVILSKGKNNEGGMPFLLETHSSQFTQQHTCCIFSYLSAYFESPCLHLLSDQSLHNEIALLYFFFKYSVIYFYDFKYPPCASTSLINVFSFVLYHELQTQATLSYLTPPFCFLFGT